MSQADERRAAAHRPTIVTLAGPNGAGKSTVATELVAAVSDVSEFLDADVFAQQISTSPSSRDAITAGRAMLGRFAELSTDRQSFGFETTLASKTFAPKIKALIAAGYAFHLVFLWLPSADLAVERVADRVRLGGHDVPTEVIRRRYRAGLRNFFAIYRPLATTWRMYDNSTERPTLIASGAGMAAPTIENSAVWQRIEAEAKRGD